LEQESAEAHPDQDGTYWAREDDDPRTRGTWVALRPHGNLVASAHLADRDAGDIHWGELNDLARRLTSS
jgi:hypothetical protein